MRTLGLLILGIACLVTLSTAHNYPGEENPDVYVNDLLNFMQTSSQELDSKKEAERTKSQIHEKQSNMYIPQRPVAFLQPNKPQSEEDKIVNELINLEGSGIPLIQDDASSMTFLESEKKISNAQKRQAEVVEENLNENLEPLDSNVSYEDKHDQEMITLESRPFENSAILDNRQNMMYGQASVSFMAEKLSSIFDNRTGSAENFGDKMATLVILSLIVPVLVVLLATAFVSFVLRYVAKNDKLSKQKLKDLQEGDDSYYNEQSYDQYDSRYEDEEEQLDEEEQEEGEEEYEDEEEQEQEEGEEEYEENSQEYTYNESYYEEENH